MQICPVMLSDGLKVKVQVAGDLGLFCNSL